MKLASEDQMAALDARFGRMASAVGRHAWSLPQLTMREKTLVFIAADLRTGGLGFPLATHIQMGATQGVAAADCRAAIRHLAPYVGYPTAAVALQQLGELEAQLPQAARQAPRPQPAGERVVLPDPARRRLSDLDEDFAAFYAEQFEQRWGDGELAPRERALCCIAVDALDQTLDEPFELHVRLAHAAGATQADIRAVLLLVAEYGLDKAWRAYRALHDLDPRGE